MKLYINTASPNVRRVRLTAAVLGLKLEEITLDFRKGEHKAPDYVKLNPNGAVPTLVDGNFILTESRSIMQYLASKRPDAGLLGRDEQSRADVTRWQFWDASHFSPQVATIAFQRIMKKMFGMGEPDESKVEEALTNFRRFAAVLNDQLAGKQYVAGNSMTLADLTLASTLMYAGPSDVPIAEFPNVQAWFSPITELDAWKQTNP